MMPNHHLPTLSTRTDYVNGRKVFARTCESAGADRLPFVLAHGLSMSSLYPVPIARRLAQEYRVYAPDLPGYGRSQHPPRPAASKDGLPSPPRPAASKDGLPSPPRTLDVEGLAGALEDWLERMGLGEVYLLGNSLGCQTIVSFILRNPGRVRRAVLAGPTMDPSARGLPKLFARAVTNMLFEPVSFYPVLARDYIAAGVRETFRALEYGYRDPIQEKLRRVTVPTLVVRGQHDRLVTQPWAEQVAGLLPQGRLVVVPGAAHVVNYDAPDRLYAEVKDFLGHGFNG